MKVAWTCKAQWVVTSCKVWQGTHLQCLRKPNSNTKFSSCKTLNSFSVSQRLTCLCDSVLHSSWDSNCVVWWSRRNAGWTLPQHSVVLVVVHGISGLPGWRLFWGFTLLSPFSQLSPSLTGLLASVDVKLQTHSKTDRVQARSRGGRWAGLSQRS